MDELNELNNYMLYPKNMIYFLKEIVEDQRNSEKVIKDKKRCIRYNKNFYVPGHKDKLFWIFYILKFGFEKYELLGSSVFQEEKSIKLELIQHVKAKTKMLKEIYNFKRLDVCESELLNEEMISLKTFHVLCIIHNINILYINDKMYCKLYLYDDDGEDAFIIQKIGDDYVYEVDPRKEIVTNYMETKFEINNYDKPIKSVSSYKLQELKDIAEEIKLPSSDLQLKKVELYNKICETLNIEL